MEADVLQRRVWGDTVPGGVNRLQRDVLALKPTIVTGCWPAAMMAWRSG
jgi:hypothetical protein